MKLVVTGSESFIGKELRRKCSRENVEYIGIDMMPSRDPHHRQVDICDSGIGGAIPEGADALIHLAALSTDKACREDTKAAFEINVGGTINLMRAARARGVKQFVFASTEWVYGEVANSGVQTEDSPIDVMRISSEYAMTKIAAERVLWAAHSAGSLPVTVLRCAIVYGPRPSNWSAVEQLFHRVREQDTVEVGSLGTARRFIHVSDIVSGILSAVGRSGYEIFNLSGNRLIALGDIIETSSKLLGRRPRIIEKYPGAASIRNPDNQRARSMLKWDPAIGLSAGLSTLFESS